MLLDGQKRRVLERLVVEVGREVPIPENFSRRPGSVALEISRSPTRTSMSPSSIAGQKLSSTEYVRWSSQVGLA